MRMLAIHLALGIAVDTATIVVYGIILGSAGGLGSARALWKTLLAASGLAYVLSIVLVLTTSASASMLLGAMFALLLAFTLSAWNDPGGAPAGQSAPGAEETEFVAAPSPAHDASDG
jgi:hypothetical protein